MVTYLPLQRPDTQLILNISTSQCMRPMEYGCDSATATYVLGTPGNVSGMIVDNHALERLSIFAAPPTVAVHLGEVGEWLKPVVC